MCLECLVKGRQGAVDLCEGGRHIHVDKLVEDLIHLALDLIQPRLHGREDLVARQLDGVIGGASG